MKATHVVFGRRNFVLKFFLFLLFVTDTPYIGAVEIISIGGACNVARAARHNKLRNAAYPFDWLIASTPAMCQAFEDDFAHMFVSQELYESGDGKSVVDGYGLIYIHDFPTIRYPQAPVDGEIMPVHGLSSNWRDALSIVQAKFYRRVQRLKKILRNGEPVALVRYNGMGKQQARVFVDMMRKKFPCAKAVLVVIGCSPEFLEPWNIPHVENRYIPEQDFKDWEGPVWGDVMQEIATLTPSCWGECPEKGGSAKGHVLTLPIYNPGFFSVFNTVIGALDLYDRGAISGLSINFERDGWYFDQEKGENWWEYYFELIALGDVRSVSSGQLFPTYQKIEFAYEAQFEMPHDRAYELIQKYIRVRPEIEEKIQQFYEKNFSGFYVIGVHYRGTDKIEAEPVTYEDVSNQVQAIIDEHHTKKIKVFVATDDARFAIYMEKRFDSLVVMQHAMRSDNSTGVHMRDDYPAYQKGEEALIDCLLLSRCSQLIKTASNLSDCSLQFNPCIPTVRLNKSYSE